MVFIVNNKDFGKHILSGGYDVNKVDSYVSWTDGNSKEHRKKTSSKVKGKIEMFFRTLDEYNVFLNALKTSERDDMTHLITLSVNNTNETVPCEAYINYTLKRARGGDWADYFEKFTLEIEEA